MEKVIAFLSGKKTYLLGLSVVVYGVYLGLFGGQEWADVIPDIFDGTLIMTIRAALAKIGVN